MSKQEQFLNDLQSFITSHPYYLETQGTQTEPNPEQTLFELSDPDGEYEALIIKTTLIS